MLKITFFLFASLLLAGSAIARSCVTTVECGTQEDCINYECVSIFTPAPFSCTANSQCAFPRKCVDGRCQSALEELTPQAESAD